VPFAPRPWPSGASCVSVTHGAFGSLPVRRWDSGDREGWEFRETFTEVPESLWAVLGGDLEEEVAAWSVTVRVCAGALYADLSGHAEARILTAAVNDVIALVRHVDRFDGRSAAHAARALFGYRAVIRTHRARLNGKDCGPCWTVGFTTTEPVFRLARKQRMQALRTTRHVPARAAYRYVTDVRPVAPRPVRCIQVAAASQQYLAGRSMVPTHNSSLIKTWAVIRQLTLGRRVVVIDKKRQQGLRADGTGTLGQGEYARLARALGVTPIRFVLGRNSGGSRINVLDPAIAGSGDSGHPSR